MTENAKTSALSEMDFILVLDSSGSMEIDDAPNGMTRWSHMQETIGQLAREIGKIDSDGLDIVMFSGHAITTHTGVTAAKVPELFASTKVRGSTPLHLALEAALKMAGKSDKRDMIIIVTDGEPDDKAAVEQVIRKATNAQVSDDALTFLFVQEGKDARAKVWLKKVDDELTGMKFDSVDVKIIEEVEAYDSFLDLLVDAIVG